VLLCLMVVLSVAGLAAPVAAVGAGFLSFVAAVLLLPHVAGSQRVVVVILTALGLAILAWGSLQGGDPDWLRMLTLNQGLIAMLAAVSFLQVIAEPGEPARPSRGRRAVVRTMAMTHALGSVINLSALILVAERLKQGDPLRWSDSVLLSRAYSSAAFWSPFWGAMAVAVTYAPGARLAAVIPLGMALALLALGVSARTVVRELGEDVADYTGFPASVEALWMPLTLVVVCLGTQALLPDVPTTGIVAMCSLALTGVVLLLRQRWGAGRTLVDHARTRLPAMGGEVTLFCSAGVLAIGIATVVQATPPPLPIDDFTAWTAWGLLLAIVAISLVGVHPAISIAAAAALLDPLDPDQTLFALTAVVAWGSVAAAGPLSGLNIVMHGQFGVDNFRLARRNWRYLAVILACALPLLHVADSIGG
jgi:hypothetical protein